MGLKVSVPADIPATLYERLKEHIKVSSDVDGSSILQYLEMAIDDAEEFTSRSIFSKTYLLTLKGFAGPLIELPKSPVSSVSSVQYYDTDGSLQTFDSSKYRVNITDQDTPTISLKEEYDWPDVEDDNPEGVQITFIAGYGADIGSVPGLLVGGLILYAGHLYDNRAIDWKGTGSQATSWVDVIRERLFRNFRARWYQ